MERASKTRTGASRARLEAGRATARREAPPARTIHAPAWHSHRRLQAAADDALQVRRVLVLQALVRGHAHRTPTATAPPLQRQIRIADNDDAVIRTVLESRPYESIARILAETNKITLLVDAHDQSLFAQGRSKLVAIDGREVASDQALSIDTLEQLSRSANVTIRIGLRPDTPGEMMATLMHELTLHVLPIIQHVGDFRTRVERAEGANIPTKLEADPDIHKDIRGIFVGDEAQHSNPQRLRDYLHNAVDVGTALKTSGHIRHGSDLILSAVNDIMTTTFADDIGTDRDRAPQLSPDVKLQIFNEADRIGTEEGTFRATRPDLFDESSDSEPSDID